MRKIAATALMIGALMGPAYPQSMQQRQEERGAKVTKTPLQIEEEERMRRAMDVEKDYDAAMKRSRAKIPDVVHDPWQNVRPGPTSDSKANSR